VAKAETGGGFDGVNLAGELSQAHDGDIFEDEIMYGWKTPL